MFLVIDDTLCVDAISQSERVGGDGGVAQQISRQYELGTSDQGTHLQFVHDDGLVIRQRNHVLLRKPTRDVPDVSSATNVNTHKSQPDDGEHHFHIRRPRPDIDGEVTLASTISLEWEKCGR